MSPRKPTIDGLDDVDVEDGVLEDEARQETDLSLDMRRAEEVGLGGARIGGEEETDENAADDWRDEDDEADQPEG
jgi:hypothetical protein